MSDAMAPRRSVESTSASQRRASANGRTAVIVSPRWNTPNTLWRCTRYRKTTPWSSSAPRPRKRTPRRDAEPCLLHTLDRASSASHRARGPRSLGHSRRNGIRTRAWFSSHDGPLDPSGSGGTLYRRSATVNRQTRCSFLHDPELLERLKPFAAAVEEIDVDPHPQVFPLDAGVEERVCLPRRASRQSRHAAVSNGSLGAFLCPRSPRPSDTGTGRGGARGDDGHRAHQRLSSATCGRRHLIQGLRISQTSAWAITSLSPAWTGWVWLRAHKKKSSE